MSLPSTRILPRTVKTQKPETDQDMASALYELQAAYESIAESVNGSFKSSYLLQRNQWMPLLKGTTTAGIFTYTVQRGWVFRKGIMVDVWGEIGWSANVGAAGNLYVELPYQVALSDDKPFIGTVQASSIAFGAGNTMIHIDAIPTTYRGEIWVSGSGVAESNLAVPASGKLIFNIRYIGVQNER